MRQFKVKEYFISEGSHPSYTYRSSHSVNCNIEETEYYKQLFDSKRIAIAYLIFNDSNPLSMLRCQYMIQKGGLHIMPEYTKFRKYSQHIKEKDQLRYAQTDLPKIIREPTTQV